MISNFTYNEKLYGLENEFLEMVNLYENNKLPNKILLSGLKGTGKCTLAYHLINYFLSRFDNEKYSIENFSININSSTFKLLQNGSNPNFHIIDIKPEKKNIDINQIRELIIKLNKSSFNDKPRFILIDNIELLNINSINALLKIVEEPNSNLYFFLIHNNNVKILDTLNSRCIKFRMFLQNSEKLEIINNLLNNNFYSELNADFKTMYNSPGEILKLYNFFKEQNINDSISIEEFINLIIEKNLFKKSLFIKKNLGAFIELYFQKKINFYKSKDKFYNLYKYFLFKINECNKYNLDIESILIEFEGKIING